MDGSAGMTNWVDVCAVEDVPLRGSRRISLAGIEVGVFRNASGRVFALDNKCPHKQGPLSEGIVHDTGVTCPLHNLVIDLETGQARGDDEGCVRTFQTDLREGRILILVES